MKYVILSARTEQEIMIVSTTITLDDNITEVTVDVPIFSPNSIDDINLAITNRAFTEQERQNRIIAIQNLVPSLPIGEIKNI